MRTKLFNEHGLQILSILLALAAWEVTARNSGLGDTYPPASRVAPVLFEFITSGEAFGPLFSTLLRTAFGFALGFAVGVLYGILTYVFPKFGEYSRGIFTIMLFTPTLIVIFLGLIMLGRTNLSVVLITAFAISTEVGVYMRDAFGSFDREIGSMSRSYHVRLRSLIKDVYLPFLVPPMLATARIGFTLAWKVTFLAEVFGFSGGLGWNLRLSYRVFDMPSLLAWLMLFIFVLLLIEQAIRLAERRLVKWTRTGSSVKARVTVG